jgi:hypothetical protein
MMPPLCPNLRQKANVALQHGWHAVRGVMLGGGAHGLEIGVDLEPVGEDAAAAG